MFYLSSWHLPREQETEVLKLSYPDPGFKSASPPFQLSAQPARYRLDITQAPFQPSSSSRSPGQLREGYVGQKEEHKKEVI